MRVLLVSHRFPPRHSAGVENYTLQLAQSLRRRHAVTVATTEKVPSRPTGALVRRRHAGLEVLEVIQNLDHDEHAGTFADPRTLATFRAILGEVKPDVVHFQHWMYWHIEVARAAREAGCRTLMTLHDFWLQCGRMGQRIDHRGELCEGPSAERCTPCLARTPFAQNARARAWIERLVSIRKFTGIPLEVPLRQLEALRQRRSAPNASGGTSRETALQMPEATARAAFEQREIAFRAALEHVDVLLTPSRNLCAELVRWGVEEARIRHVPQGLDEAPFRDRPRPSPRTDGPLRLGFLGTLAPHKGAHVLLEAVEGLPADSYELHIYGPSGSDRAYMEQLRAHIARLPAVHLHEPVPRAELAKTFAALDLVCVPSLWFECCPLVIQEAFLCGTPCLVSDLGGMAELVRPGVGGLRARPGDPGDWRRVLAGLLGDRAGLAQLRASLPAVPSFEQHVEALESLYAHDAPQGR